jgi:hypothetical protein
VIQREAAIETVRGKIPIALRATGTGEGERISFEVLAGAIPASAVVYHPGNVQLRKTVALRHGAARSQLNALKCMSFMALCLGNSQEGCGYYSAM